MGKLLQVGNNIYDYPEQGTGEGHGEDATAWAEAVTDALANFLGPNDILLTTQTLANGATDQNIPDLSFNLGQVQHVNIEYLTIRQYVDGGSIIVVESGKIYGNYNQSDFRISIESVGDDTGVDFDVTAAGQFTYSSSTLPNHTSSLVYFKASTIDQ